MYYGKDGKWHNHKETPDEYSRRRAAKGLDPRWQRRQPNGGCLLLLLPLLPFLCLMIWIITD